VPFSLVLFEEYNPHSIGCCHLNIFFDVYNFAFTNNILLNVPHYIGQCSIKLFIRLDAFSNFSDSVCCLHGCTRSPLDLLVMRSAHPDYAKVNKTFLK